MSAHTARVQALAPHVTYIIGIDEDKAMVKLYNEIAIRQGHPTCYMRAIDGDIMKRVWGDLDKDPDTEKLDKDTNEAMKKKATEAEEAAARKRLEPFKDFNLAVIAVGSFLLVLILNDINAHCPRI